MAQLVKNSLAEQDTQVPSLVGKTPWRRERLPTQDPGLENSMGCIVHGVAKSQTPPSNSHIVSQDMSCDWNPVPLNLADRPSTSQKEHLEMHFGQTVRREREPGWRNNMCSLKNTSTNPPLVKPGDAQVWGKGTSGSEPGHQPAFACRRGRRAAGLLRLIGLHSWHLFNSFIQAGLFCSC